MTNIDGRFVFDLTTSNPVLLISSIGYETLEVIIEFMGGISPYTNYY